MLVPEFCDRNAKNVRELADSFEFWLGLAHEESPEGGWLDSGAFGEIAASKTAFCGQGFDVLAPRANLVLPRPSPGVSVADARHFCGLRTDCLPWGRPQAIVGYETAAATGLPVRRGDLSGGDAYRSSNPPASGITGKTGRGATRLVGARKRDLCT